MNLRLKPDKVQVAQFILTDLPDEEIVPIDFGCGTSHLDIAIFYLLRKKRLHLRIKKLILFDLIDCSEKIQDWLSKVQIEFHKVDYSTVDLSQYLDKTTQYYTVVSHFDGISGVNLCATSFHFRMFIA